MYSDLIIAQYNYLGRLTECVFCRMFPFTKKPTLICL